MPATVTHTLRFPAPSGPISFDQLTEADRVALRGLARHARLVVDVGTFLGGSAETMLDAMPTDGELITVDTFEGTVGANTAAVSTDRMKAYAVQRLSRFGSRVRIVQAASADLAHVFRPGAADLVFLDAAHDYENVKADIAAWLPALKPGGIMAGHDYDKRSAFTLTEKDIMERSHLDWDRESGVHCGVIRAVSESFGQIMQSDDLTSSVWWTAPECAR